MVESARDPVPFRPYAPGTQPPYDAPDYGSTHKRHPQEDLVRLPHTVTETTGPRFSAAQFLPIADLSVVNGKSALGERIIVHGRITDEDGRPVPHTIVEIWQANASGRYHHPADQHDAPTDPNFHGEGRVYTDEDGLVPIHLDQARRLSLAQSPRCLAAEPHPFLVFRLGPCPAARHSDVFPGRPAARSRSGLSLSPR